MKAPRRIPICITAGGGHFGFSFTIIGMKIEGVITSGSDGYDEMIGEELA